MSGTDPVHVAAPTNDVHDSPAVPEFRGEILRTIRSQWHNWGFGPMPHDLSWLLVTRGSHSSNKIVALLFADRDPYPRIAVKMVRTEEGVTSLTNEARTLEALDPTVLDPGTIPRILFCRRHGGVLTVGETIVTGEPLSRLLQRGNFRSVALQATHWLARLARRPQLSWPEGSRNPLMTVVVARFVESFGPVLDAGSVRDTADLVASLGSLPPVCEHRDYAPWNLFMTNVGELGVLDWESSELRGMPFLDLIYFLTHSAFVVDGARSTGQCRPSYRATLDPSTFTGGVASECLAAYARETGFDLSNLPALRLLTWLVHAGSEYRRMMAEVRGTPEPTRLRRGLYLALWEEELRHSAHTLPYATAGVTNPAIQHQRIV